MRDVSSRIVRVRDQVWSRVWNGFRGQVGRQAMARVRRQLQNRVND